jgi:hypothetical protein
LLVGGLQTAYGQSESGTIQITIDSPDSGATLRSGDQITIGGWAVDTTAGGSAVETVELFIDGQPGEGGIRMGRADYGKERPDVAEFLGNPALAEVGFDLNWKVTGGGTRTVYVFAYSPTHGWAYEELTINVEETSIPTTGQDESGAYIPASPGFSNQPSYSGPAGLAGPAYGPSVGQAYGPMSPEAQYGVVPLGYPASSAQYGPTYPYNSSPGGYQSNLSYGYAPNGGVSMAPVNPFPGPYAPTGSYGQAYQAGYGYPGGPGPFPNLR